MSTNCIHCVTNKRTASDLLCDDCRPRSLTPQKNTMTTEPKHTQEIDPLWLQGKASLIVDFRQLQKINVDLLDACKATLLFHRGLEDWNTDGAPTWAKLTGGREATTKGLCDCIRAAIDQAEEGKGKSGD